MQVLDVMNFCKEVCLARESFGLFDFSICHFFTLFGTKLMKQEILMMI